MGRSEIRPAEGSNNFGLIQEIEGMDVDRCSIADLFQQSRRHVVPLYQRAYVWNEEQHWQPLWEDIRELVAQKIQERPTPDHFLGALVRSRAPSSGLRLDSRLVIDGQQRLTTMQILIAALRDRVTEFAVKAAAAVRENVGELEKQLNGFTVNSGVVKQDIERHKVWPTNADREHFEAILKCRSRAALDARYPPEFVGKNKERVADPRRTVEAYRFFDDRVQQLITEFGGDDDERIATLLDAAVGSLSHLKLVVIDLDEADDAQEIFETLNFRGAPLLASDLVKNFVFSRASAARLSPDELYEKHWRHFDSDEGAGFWKRELTQGRLRRPIFDTFIDHYLQCKATTPDSVVSRHLYQSFKVWWDESKRDVEHELTELRRYSEIYRTFHEPTSVRAKSPRLATFLSRTQALDTTTVYPLLLFVLADHHPKLSAPERDAILTDLESYLVRRAIVGASAKNLNRAFGTMLKDLRQGGPLTPQGFRERLKAFGGGDWWPNDEEFAAEWLRNPIYKRMKSRGVQMILRALHDALIGPKQEAIIVPDDLTLEHVLPQNWTANWPLPTGDEGTKEQELTSRRNHLIHTIGNLTLLNNKLNPEASNRSYGEKRDAFKNSVLVLNRYFDKVETWNEQEILKRAQALLEQAKSIWPAP